jgi:hypothetical protein
MSEEENETFIGGSHEGKLDWTILGLACFLFVGMLMTTLAFPFYSGQPFHPTEQSKAEAEFKALMDSLPVTTVQDIRANRAREERRKEEIVRLHDEQVAEQQNVTTYSDASLRQNFTRDEIERHIATMKPVKVELSDRSAALDGCRMLTWEFPANLVVSPRLLGTDSEGVDYYGTSTGSSADMQEVLSKYVLQRPELEPVSSTPCPTIPDFKTLSESSNEPYWIKPLVTGKLTN